MKTHSKPELVVKKLILEEYAKADIMLRIYFKCCLNMGFLKSRMRVFLLIKRKIFLMNEKIKSLKGGHLRGTDSRLNRRLRRPK